MIKIGHLALWTEQLEEMRSFYMTYFGAVSNEKYVNPAKEFESYFLYFAQGAALEIMRSTHIHTRAAGERIGYCHVAFELAGKEEVCALTERLRADGYTIAGEPRTSGDGYFESVVLDVDCNRVELVAAR